MKKYLALTASAMGAATVSGVALLTSSPSCIISGSTERSCSSVAWSAETDLDSRVTTADYGAPSECFDTRLQAYGYGDAMDFFRSDAPGLTILIH